MRRLPLACVLLFACTEPNPNAEGDGDSESTGESGESGGGECGNGELETGEECDEGSANANDAACKADCTTNVCGDGFQGPGEGCDEGSDNAESAACTDECQPATCGDGKTGPNEQCDDGEANDDEAACKSNCELATCGDGLVAPSEECDDANADESDGCRSNCRTVESMSCDSASVEAGEWCFRAFELETAFLGDSNEIVVGDIDGDGDEDLVAASRDGKTLRWITAASEEFTLRQENDYSVLSEEIIPGPLLLHDFVDDDLLDTVALTYIDTNTIVEFWARSPDAADFVELFDTGSPVTLPSESMVTATTVQFGPSDPLIIAAMSGTDPSVHVFGTTGTPTTFSVPHLAFMYGMDFGAGHRRWLLMHVPYLAPPQFEVYTPSGPNLMEVQVIELGVSSEDEAGTPWTGDLDGDGFDDLLYLNTNSCTGPDTNGCTENSLVIWRGSDAAEPLVFDRKIPVGFGARAFAVADFNADGALDVIVGRGATGDFLALETDGEAGVFPYQRVIASDIDGSETLHAGDFNGDGIPDLLAHSSPGFDAKVMWSRP